VLVLNYNGRALLEECLPSVIAAAEASQHACQVMVVDNASTDDSVELLRQRLPQVAVVGQVNRGLCSFNAVLATLRAPLALLLNNDIKLDPGCIDPLVEPLLRDRSGGPRCFMAAPRCWQFDGATHEGFRTAVRWRWGLVQATALFPGHEEIVELPGPTASAGAAMAVDREIFLQLGGFDPLYLPGRIEDLDFAFRGYLAGYQALYVPSAIAYHRGLATFGPAFSQRGCDQLALRNTLLFQWKNLRHPWHVTRQALGLPLRMLRDVITAPVRARGERFSTWRAVADAWRRRAQIAPPKRPADAAVREARFFRDFHPQAMRRGVKGEEQSTCSAATGLLASDERSVERLRDRRHPISRWYLLPLADWVSRRLTRSAVQPWHVTVSGAAVAAAAGVCMCLGLGGLAAVMVLAAWFCDRLDGKLARRQKTESPWGAWLDANLDELTDLGLHAALALATAAATQSSLPWAFFTAFLFGKYLFVHGLTGEQAAGAQFHASERQSGSTRAETDASWSPWLRRIYHLPGNADVRVHMLALLLLAGWWTAELLLVAAYFNFRWMARYFFVARRLGSPASAIHPSSSTLGLPLSKREASRAA
jgi:GT2 family glycosyltransferase/phosphatidylglycerophosphate synthase